MEEYKIIGNNLNLFRKKLNLTQDNVAHFLGIKREMLSYYETGERIAPLDFLNKLSDLYGVELKDLLEKNFEDTKINVALSFRAEKLNEQDLKTIANFRKIVKNYLKMIKLENENEKRLN